MFPKHSQHKVPKRSSDRAFIVDEIQPSECLHRNEWIDLTQHTSLMSQQICFCYVWGYLCSLCAPCLAHTPPSLHIVLVQTFLYSYTYIVRVWLDLPENAKKSPFCKELSHTLIKYYYIFYNYKQVYKAWYCSINVSLVEIVQWRGYTVILFYLCILQFLGCDVPTLPTPTSVTVTPNDGKYIRHKVIHVCVLIWTKSR